MTINILTAQMCVYCCTNQFRTALFVQSSTQKKCGPRLLLQSHSRELWVRQLCTVPSSDRHRRFLQYNFMDPGWGARISYGGQVPMPPSLAPALDIRECERVLGLFPHAKFHRYPFTVQDNFCGLAPKVLKIGNFGINWEILASNHHLQSTFLS